MARVDRIDLLASSGIAESPADESSATSCLHCGLDVPRNRLARGNRFCCSGCDHVYKLIHESNLEQYYELRPERGVPVSGFREDAFGWLEPMLGAAQSSDGLLRLALDIQGVHCAACVWLLQQLYERHTGAVQLRINPGRGSADLVWDPALGDVREYLAGAMRFGYRFGPRTGRPPAKSNGILIRLGISAAAAMNVMIFSLCYYFGLSPSDGWIYTVLGQVSVLLTAVAAFVGGEVFFRSTWNGIRRGVVHLDLPIALGILLAFSGSVVAYVLWGPEKAYFDTVTVFVTLMLVGRWLQERVIERNRLSVLSSDGLDAIFVRRVVRHGSADGDAFQERVEVVSGSSIQSGDVLLVVPGDMVPVSGVLQDGNALLSLEWITGESEVVDGLSVATIPAGSFNAGTSAFRLVAKEAFAESRVHDLLSTPAPRERESGQDRWWSRASSVYVASVLLLAVAGFAVWATRDLTKALEVTIATLVVTCPCAIGLAVPLAKELSLLALKRRGVFVRSQGLLDRALAVRRIFFDKTGTLTLGRMTLDPSSRARLAELPAEGRAILYEMSVRSNHPRSRAIVAALSELDTAEEVAEKAARGTDTSTDTSTATATVTATATTTATAPLAVVTLSSDAITEHPGLGLECRHDGVYRLGRPSFVLGAEGVAAEDAADQSATIFGRDGALLLSLSFDEELRGDASDEVSRLRSSGLEIELLSGDSPERTTKVAEQLGIAPEHAFGGLTPEEKSERVRALDRHDSLMVGDGLNDAAGLDSAFVAGTPAIDHPSLPARADFYFLGEGIAAVRLVLAAASQLSRVVRTNLTVAVAYNAFALALCFTGRVSPVSAAILMPISSIGLVLLTVYRMKGKEGVWTS